MILNILHERFIFTVEWMKYRVLTTIEFQWNYLMPLAELDVKCRGRLAPLTVYVKLGETVIDEQIRP